MKKGIYSIPINADELLERVIAHIKSDKDFEFAIKLLDLSKVEKTNSINTKEKLQVSQARMFYSGLQIGSILSFYLMGGKDPKRGNSF